jgi:acid stress chaperone HdeA
MNKTLSMIVGSLLMIPALGQAAENHKPVSQWTCEDFLATDTTFQPTVVGFAEALNKKDKPEDAVLDVKGVETVTLHWCRHVCRIKKPILRKKLTVSGTKSKKICN